EDGIRDRNVTGVQTCALPICFWRFQVKRIAAVCMANGSGGTVVFGVADRVKGRANAIIGVPPEIDPNILKKAVYDQTDPKIIPLFEELRVPEGTGRLLIMQI